jgi:hypothetical protein
MATYTEKFGSELDRFRAELLDRFSRSRAAIRAGYHEADDDTRITYDAILKLARQSWLREQLDNLEFRRRRIFASTIQSNKEPPNVET